jgi:uncharacterized protein
MISESDWAKISQVFGRGFSSCMHFALATVNEDGSPHVAPIGSLFLRETPSGFYFDEFTVATRKNLSHNPRVCILAVNADKTFWGKALLQGRFDFPPAIRLLGTAGELREAKPEEVAVWQKRIAFARLLKGYELLWGHMSLVHDVQFDSFEPVDMGRMTFGLW